MRERCRWFQNNVLFTSRAGISTLEYAAGESDEAIPQEKRGRRIEDGREGRVRGEKGRHGGVVMLRLEMW